MNDLRAAGPQLFLFCAAGYDFAVPIVDVDRLIEELDIAPVPLCHRALAGVAVDEAGDEQRLIPVFDLRGFERADQVPVQVKGATVAVFQTETGPIGMRMDLLLGTSGRAEPISDSEVVQAHIDSLGPELLTTVTAVAKIDDKAFFTFSPEAFLMRLNV
ncbi:MAG: hypothetical protein GY822_27910 [Deltaproteobacteria bacterium]|nr:hypothetical protein [Deltaproteobacteria bacterium]